MCCASDHVEPSANKPGHRNERDKTPASQASRVQGQDQDMKNIEGELLVAARHMRSLKSVEHNVRNKGNC